MAGLQTSSDQWLQNRFILDNSLGTSFRIAKRNMIDASFVAKPFFVDCKLSKILLELEGRPCYEIYQQ